MEVGGVSLSYSQVIKMRKAQKIGLKNVKWNAEMQKQRRGLIYARRLEKRTEWKTIDFSQHSRRWLINQFLGWYSLKAIDARIEKASAEVLGKNYRSLSPSKSFGLGSLFGNL